MNNPLYDELLNLRYIPINEIDEELPPESVVLYFKNLSQLDKRISVEPIHGVQIDLQNQNPTIELEDYKATFCLGPSPYIPIVTIDPIEDFVDPQYPLSVTFTGTISRSDNYIPNEIVVNYNDLNKRATLINDTQWTVTFDLRNVDQNLTDYVSVKANSIDVNSSVISGYSDIVTGQFNIIFLEVECTPSVDKVSCLCLDITKTYKVTVDGESVTGTFEEVVDFLDSHGLYAYPGGLECDPCAESTNRFTTTILRPLQPEPSMAMMAIEDSTSHHVFTINDGVEEFTVESPKFLYSYNLFRDILSNLDDLSITSADLPGETITSYKNLSDQKREIRVTADSEDAIKALGKIEFDDFTRTLEYIDNTFKLCLLGTQPVTCQSSTSPIASFDNLPMLSDVSISCNDIAITLQQIADGLAPFNIVQGMYGIEFINRTEECLLIEFRYSDQDVFFPPSTTLGVESESLPGIFKLSLAPQIFDPIEIRIEFIDKQNGYTVSGELLESSVYSASISALSNNPDPNWKGKVIYNGEEYELFTGYDERVSIDVTIPSNKTWISHPYVYDFDVTSDFEFTYEGGAKPAFDVSYLTLNNPSSTWSYGVSGETVQATYRHSYNASNTYSKNNILTVQLDSVYAGLTTGEPFNATVDSSGLLTVDLSKSYPYNSGWTTDWKISQYISLKNSQGSQVAWLGFYVYLDTFRFEVELREFPGSYTPTGEILNKVNQPFTKFKLGPLPDITKVSLTVHQDGLGNAALVREPTFLDVVDNYVYYTAPTPTEVYSPYVTEPVGAYKVTTLLLKVIEGDPKYVGWMKQSQDLKYVVTA